MSTKINCEHQCRNTCAMLEEGVKEQVNLVSYFQKMLADCDEPEMKKFAKELIDSQKDLVQRINDRLNVIKSKAAVLDNIMAGYES